MDHFTGKIGIDTTKKLPREGRINCEDIRANATMAKEPPIKIRATVIVPVLNLLVWKEDGFRSISIKPLLDTAISELISFSAEDLRLTNYQAENLLVKLRKKSKRKGRQKSSVVLQMPTIELEWSVNLTLTNFQAECSSGKPIPLSTRISLHKQLARENFAHAVIAILVASQIAQPGILRTNDLEIWDGNRFLQTSKRVSGFFYEILDFAEAKGWPKLESLSIKQVWQWMCSFDPISQNLGNSEVGRALNAVTYLLSEKPNHHGGDLVDLMWAMIGLESLYGRGTADLTYQLVEKAGVLLGRQPGFEKSVREMYRFRSLFIHGKAYFLAHFLPLMECKNTTVIATKPTMPHFLRQPY